MFRDSISQSLDAGGPGNPVGYAGYLYIDDFGGSSGDFGLEGRWYARHRFYDPIAGRWITRDPAGYVDGMSLYLYVHGNPFSGVDPMGLNPMLGLGGLAGVAIDYAFGPRVRPAVETVATLAFEGAVNYVGDRVDNMAAGAAAGAVSGAGTGAAVGAGVGAFAGGAGAIPGAGAGALTGGVGGAISGAVSGLLSADGATALDTAKEGAVGGVIDGLTAGVGTKVLTPVKVVGKVASKTDEAVDVARVGAKASARADDVAEGSGQSTSAWRAGRYSERASQPGAYQNSGGRVFPTRRNSGLSGDTLRAEQQAFVERRLAEGADIGEIRGQAAAAGLTRYVDDADRLADPGAEAAVKRAVERHSNKCNNE